MVLSLQTITHRPLGQGEKIPTLAYVITKVEKVMEEAEE